jgi:hypothetical protein
MLGNDASEARALTPGPKLSPPPGDPPTESPPPPGGPSAESPPSHWPERVNSIARYTGQWVARPRVRLSLTGVLLLLIGGLFVTNSVWTLPLVVVGALMVVVAWIGHRLDGRFAIEWGETGTEFAFRATIKPAAAVPEAGAPVLAGEPAPSPALESPAGGDDDVIDGEAHTVEIDVAELRALIAAAEAAGPPDPVAPATDIRIRRAADTARSDTARSSQPIR